MARIIASFHVEAHNLYLITSVAGDLFAELFQLFLNLFYPLPNIRLYLRKCIANML